MSAQPRLTSAGLPDIPNATPPSMIPWRFTRDPPPRKPRQDLPNRRAHRDRPLRRHPRRDRRRMPCGRGRERLWQIHPRQPHPRPLPPTTGTLTFDGQPLPAARTLAHRRAIQLVQQNPASALNPRRSVAASIRLPLDVHTIGAPPNAPGPSPNSSPTSASTPRSPPAPPPPSPAASASASPSPARWPATPA